MSARALGPRRPWTGRRVVLGVTGGIAAYKSVQLARDLTRLGVEVDTVLTRGARRFLRPLVFEGVTGRPVRSDHFEVEGAALHVRLGREADVVCVAPATADFIARAARGRADDLITATLLAHGPTASSDEERSGDSAGAGASRAAGPPPTTSPPSVLVCPAMNHRMYRHPATRANLDRLADRLDYEIAGPDVGPLAHGEEDGPGRMVEPGEIVERIGRMLARGGPFEGRTVLVTAGPTREPLDPVRFLSNRSSGRMGHALARAAWRRGARTILVTGPTELPDPVGVERVPVETAVDMERAVREHLAGVDVAIFAAAVSDYRPARSEERKIKRSETGESTSVELRMNPDIAAGTRDRCDAGCVRVGFALETEELLERAGDKLERKGFDLLVANDATVEGAGFGTETNRVAILTSEGDTEELPLLTKDEVAEEILDRVARRWGAGV